MFSTECDIRIIDDSGIRPKFRTLAALGFVDSSTGQEFFAPADFVSDGSSVPLVAMGAIGYRGLRAGVLHDYYVHAVGVQREDADILFYRALVASEVPQPVASMMYRAVAAFTANLRGQRASGPDDTYGLG